MSRIGSSHSVIRASMATHKLDHEDHNCWPARLLFDNIRDKVNIQHQDIEICIQKSPACNWGSRGMHGDEVKLKRSENLVPRMLKVAVTVFALLPLKSMAVQIYETFPNEIRVNERYVIYSHGLIVEGDDPRPVHPTLGVYDFPAIKQALFLDGGFNLIAHQRPKNTEISAYVAILESWVRRLVAAGVKPGRITLVGFSRGGHLSAYASGRLVDLGLNTAIMGACSNGDIARDPPLTLAGNFMSIYETTDSVRSCEKIAQRSRLASFEEIAISTGKEHAAFFRPLPEWVDSLKQWIQKTNR